MAQRRIAPDRWHRLLAPAERSAVLLAESLRDPVEPLRPQPPRRRSWHSVVRLIRRVRRRLRL